MSSLPPPSSPRIGGLCFGYGGLDLAVQAVIPDAELAWYAEFDKGASKIGAHHWPNVPNYGDMTKIDWADVEPVDIITGGTPCQDLSHAGRRAGMTEGTRSNLWVAMREAIATIRPSLVIWENVGGAFSAAADSEVEPCAGCVGDGSGVHLRALQRVLGDLASLGFDAEWRALRAADIGAPHGRLRVFVVAYPERRGRDGWARTTGRAALGGVAADGSSQGPLLPTPRSTDGDKGLRTRDGAAAAEFERKGVGSDLATVLALLPTPAVNDMGEGKTVAAWDEWTAKMQAAHGNGNGHGKSLAIELQRVESGWGPYTAAVERWERILGRPAPPPAEGARVREWMMGLPEGWVTDVPGITRNEALKALGNGVVPQQAVAALWDMLAPLDFGEVGA